MQKSFEIFAPRYVLTNVGTHFYPSLAHSNSA